MVFPFPMLFTCSDSLDLFIANTAKQKQVLWLLLLRCEIPTTNYFYSIFRLFYDLHWTAGRIKKKYCYLMVFSACAKPAYVLEIIQFLIWILIVNKASIYCTEKLWFRHHTLHICMKLVSLSVGRSVGPLYGWSVGH